MSSTTTLRQRFEELVKRAEAEVAANPTRYKRRLAALAALGYLVIFALLAILVSILGGTVALAMTSSAFLILLLKNKLFLILIVPIWVLARSLFVRVRAPEGYALTRKEHPGVWREIDALRSRLHALPIHKVVLTPEMNAAVTQTPRLGLFGPYKNTLVLGLELLMSLSPEQARAVLAHEFGHLSGDHGRFGTWIYRKRLTWARIQAAFDEHHSFGTGLIRRFMDWYVPRLAGYSFALARQQEYEADAVAAKLTSPRAAGSALVQCATRSELTGEMFWKPLLRRALHEPEPEARTYSALFHHLKASLPDRGTLETRISEAMRVRTGYADTHPALRDRLSALGMPPAFDPAPQSAAEVWLGAALANVVADFDAQWLSNNSTAWANRHEYARAAFEHLKELSAKSAGELTQMEAWQVASLTEELMPQVDPLLAYKAYRARYPDDPDADFVIGRLLLADRNDPNGIAHLEKAAERAMLREPAYGMIAAFYNRNSRPDLSEAWLRKAEAAFDENQEARRERDSITGSDAFKTPGLDENVVQGVVSAIRASSVGGKIKRIWIAEKVVSRYPELPVYVVLVKPAFLSRGKDEIGAKLGQELPQTMNLPNTWFFAVDTSDNRAVARKIKAAGREVG